MTRTKFFDRWTEKKTDDGVVDVGTDQFDRDEENIKKTEKHEEKHRKNFKEWHDKYKTKAEKDFNTACDFASDTMCNNERKKREKAWQDGFKTLNTEEVEHDKNTVRWRGYERPPRERKPKPPKAAEE
jgi:hypothetical protein